MRLRKYRIFVVLVMLVATFSFISCSDDDDNDNDNDTPSVTTPEETVFFYFPYSGLYSYFLENIKAFETAIVNNQGLGKKRLMVFIATSASNAYLYEISYNNGICVHDTLKNYYFGSAEYTTSSGITSILEDMMTESPTNSYSMIIGCHGMGWIPKSVSSRAGMFKPENPLLCVHQTRYFGDSSSTSNTYKTDITTFAEGIKATGVKMQYILFDDCYMSNIETAYDLREVTDYLIASTCEIMIEGMPYAYIGKSLLDHDYQGVCDGFYAFYSAYNPPCGTIGVTDCRETENMAYIMKNINTMYPDGLSDTDTIQILDGYTPAIFFDFGDYVAHLCEDVSLLSAFNAELDKLVPYKANTDTYYTQYDGGRRISLTSFSGLTISDPSQNSTVTEVKTQTNWYYATH
ncbi:MAG: clostripain-related cysteine peptidase [Prevotella sp.]|nr:clostripain-related cysteine peptidase [Prevotella sp.]